MNPAGSVQRIFSSLRLEAVAGAVLPSRWLILLCVALAVIATSVDAGYNWNAKWQLHYAGVHDSLANTCDFQVFDCLYGIEVSAPAGPGRYDIYIIALDTNGIAETRFGLNCDGSFFFYSWTGCSDTEDPTVGWPGCGEGITLSWDSEQPPGHVTMGILDVYVYSGVSLLCTSPDPRVGYGEWCDASTPDPACVQFSDPPAFGCVGFGQMGYNSCGVPPVQIDQGTWGRVKALYR
jgi:hypothetical protein